MKSKPKFVPVPVPVESYNVRDVLARKQRELQANPPKPRTAAEQAEFDKCIAELSKDPGFFILKP